MPRKRRRSEKQQEISIEIRPRAALLKNENDESSDNPAEEKTAEEKPRRSLFPSFTSPFDPEKKVLEPKPAPNSGRKFAARLEEAPFAPSPDDAEEKSASPAGGDESPKVRRKRKAEPKPGIAAFLGKFRSYRVPLLGTCGLAVVLLIIVFFWAHALGVSSGIRKAENAAPGEVTDLQPEVWAELEKGLEELHAGDSEAAFRRFKDLQQTQKTISSLDYLLGLAAMQNGDVEVSEESVKNSIRKGERVSDSWALLAVLAGQKGSDPGRPTMGDPRLRAEALLRQAILADPVNPSPRVELAVRLRSRGQTDDAEREFRAAEACLTPVDSHITLKITLELIDIDKMPADKLPTEIPDSDDPVKLFPAAYSAMRRGDFAAASALLERCQETASPALFAYLKSDAVFRRYRDESALAKFLR